MRVLASFEPWCRRLPTKKVGVPRAPLASASATSSLIRDGVALFVDIAEELLDVEAEASGVAGEVLELELVLVGEEQVVHLPEPALRGGSLRGGGGELGMRVHVRKRQVPEDVPQVVAEVFPNFLAPHR